jgi:endonuclease-3
MRERRADAHSDRPKISLKAAVERLTPLYAQPRLRSDPLALIVWENIGYLIDDARRTALFDEFCERIGLSAAQIANAPTAILSDIARRGGMNALGRSERLRKIGQIAIAECDGDLLSHLRQLPVAKARQFLKRFPGIGDPGADKILLFGGIATLPSADSNGLRTLVRLGFCAEEKSYAQTYKSAVAVLGQTGKGDGAWLALAYGLLREHGKALCKRAAPICEPCPLDRVCAHRMIAKL